MSETPAPRGFVRMQIDLYPDQSDKLNELARARGMSKKSLMFQILQQYIEQETASVKGKKK